MAKARSSASKRPAARPKVPAAVRSVLFASSSTIELRVKVSDRTGVKQYGFAFDGVPVAMSQGAGKFNAQANQQKLLEWVMVGDAGGTMKVTVTRNGTTVKERAKSKIPDSETKGYDALQILVS